MLSLTASPPPGPGSRGCIALSRLLIYRLILHLLRQAVSDSAGLLLVGPWGSLEGQTASPTSRDQCHGVPRGSWCSTNSHENGLQDRNGLCPWGVCFLFATITKQLKREQTVVSASEATNSSCVASVPSARALRAGPELPSVQTPCAASVLLWPPGQFCPSPGSHQLL